MEILAPTRTSIGANMYLLCLYQAATSHSPLLYLFFFKGEKLLRNVRNILRKETLLI